MKYTSKQSGYTLLELLMYVAIVGALLGAVVVFFGMIVESRVKNQSISEVNDQGTALMDYITQTIRNSSSITSPTAGTSAASLTLAVPTGSLSPTIFDSTSTVMGYATDGGTTDGSNSNFINATKFTAGATGTIQDLYVYMGPTVAASPNNLGQMALYSGATPTTLLGSSSSAVIKADSWNMFEIDPVTVTSGQTYWLAFNTNGLNTLDNNMRYHTGTTGQALYVAQTYGTWPGSWTGTSQNREFSMYAPIFVSSSPSVARVKEGTGANISLTSSKVHVSGLTFKNLTRSGTNGVVQIRFTVSRVNPNNRNEYDYQKTFIGTAEVGW